MTAGRRATMRPARASKKAESGSRSATRISAAHSRRGGRGSTGRPRLSQPPARKRGIGKGTLVAWVIGRVTRGELPGDLTRPAGGRRRARRRGQLRRRLDAAPARGRRRPGARRADRTARRRVRQHPRGPRETRSRRPRARASGCCSSTSSSTTSASGSTTGDKSQSVTLCSRSEALARELDIAVLGCLHPNKRADSFRAAHRRRPSVQLRLALKLAARAASRRRGPPRPRPRQGQPVPDAAGDRVPDRRAPLRRQRPRVQGPARTATSRPAISPSTISSARGPSPRAQQDRGRLRDHRSATAARRRNGIPPSPSKKHAPRTASTSAPPSAPPSACSLSARSTSTFPARSNGAGPLVPTHTRLLPALSPVSRTVAQCKRPRSLTR